MKASILVGDARSLLAELADGSVQTCITSPPYFGLRDYGTATWDGGDVTCDHKGPPKASESSGLNHRAGRSTYEMSATVPFIGTCGKCGARRIDAQIGLEQTPEAYVAGLVAVFQDVRRVLADDGTLWLNLGDSYAGSGPSGASYQSKTTVAREGKTRDGTFAISKTLGQRGLTYAEKKPVPPPGLKPKDLIGIPWRVALALQADGWYLRQDIIWAKPNPMPESVKDRCTKSHEYLFLLSKSARYYYDAAAIAEDSIYGARGSEFDTGKTGEHQLGRAQPRGRRAGAGRLTYEGKRQGEEGQGQEAFVSISETRNKRDVWTISTKPFKGAHFAVMPEALVEPCVLAGSAEGDLVLDPFTGSGTVGVVALRHQRDFVGIELNPEYAEMAEQRIKNAAPLLNSVSLSGAAEEEG